jgi:hypothetical protein
LRFLAKLGALVSTPVEPASLVCSRVAVAVAHHRRRPEL